MFNKLTIASLLFLTSFNGVVNAGSIWVSISKPSCVADMNNFGTAYTAACRGWKNETETGFKFVDTGFGPDSRDPGYTSIAKAYCKYEDTKNNNQPQLYTVEVAEALGGGNAPVV